MSNGTVHSIHISTNAGAKLEPVREVRAVPGKGLEGDRYFNQGGTFSRKAGPDRELTLIELEAIDALKRDYKVEVEPGDARRNIVTAGVALNHLVGKDFSVGEVLLHGIRLCEPCQHLAELTSQETSRALVHRGGLRAQILSEGFIRVGDEVRRQESQ
ncbi:MAG TPA: MOSC domain-containing protein [Blastocatellia bacterium]|nr:MOSC domain-containing protein [Blastocatellia bacterium]